MKRAMDILFAGLGLMIMAPLFLVVGLLIKVTDRGPILFGQTRVGQFGKPFRIWKFRSMVVDAERNGAKLTSEEDQRITRLGRILRKTKLDELPQLWNVLVGEMSLVGPRPEVARYVACYTTYQRQTLNYKPGITDLASLLFRNEEQLLRGANDLEAFYLRYCLPKKLELNLQYSQGATPFQDIWIILRTVTPRWLGAAFVNGLCLVFSFWLSIQLKADFLPSSQEYSEFREFLPLIVLPQVFALIWTGQLSGLLSYFSIPEMRKTMLALAAALVVQAALGSLFQHRLIPSPGVLGMDFLLSLVALCGVRLALRLLRERSTRAQPDGQSSRRVALIGTGELATHLLIEFQRGGNPARRVVAFFDDDPYQWHKRPHNVPVIGMPECLLNRGWRDRIDEVIVTLPEKETRRIQQLTQLLQGLYNNITVASGRLMPKTQ